MNIGQLNFINRQKIQKQVILPHTPTYVINDRNKNDDVWYFTSEKYMTLKKKKENTLFSKFIKEKICVNDNNSNRNSNEGNSYSEQDNHKNFNNQIPKSSKQLVFIIKQSINYLKLKLRHAIIDHSKNQQQFLQNNKFTQSSQCPICNQIQTNDYNCILLEKQELIQNLLMIRNSKHKQSNLNDKNSKDDTQKTVFQSLPHCINQVMQACLLNCQSYLKNKTVINPTNIIHSTFNPFLNNLICIQGFKYYITRIQQKVQKKHFMTQNANRINYRQEVNNKNGLSKEIIQRQDNQSKKKSINQIKYSPQVLFEKISSLVWNREYLLFDFDKDIDNKDHNKRPQQINSHMKQKISQKCQIITSYLENYFMKLFKEELSILSISKTENINSKNRPHQQDLVSISQRYKNLKINVKQFRLWYMNNNMKNNYIYTICVSDIKVCFMAQQKINENRQQQKLQKFTISSEFFTNINIKLNLQFKNNLDSKRNQFKRDFKHSQSHSSDISGQNLKSYHAKQVKSSKILLANNQYRNVINRNDRKKTYSKVQDTENQTIQAEKQFQQKSQYCKCCQIQFEENKQSFFKDQNVRKNIIYRHINHLKQKVYEKLITDINSIQFKLKSCHQTSQSEDNQLYFKLKQMRDKLKKLQPTISQNKTSQNPTFHNKKDQHKNIQNDYSQVQVCEQCYKVFLSQIIGNQYRKDNKKYSFYHKKNNNYISQLNNKIYEDVRIRKKQSISTVNRTIDQTFNSKNYQHINSVKTSQPKNQQTLISSYQSRINQNNDLNNIQLIKKNERQHAKYPSNRTNRAYSATIYTASNDYNKLDFNNRPTQTNNQSTKQIQLSKITGQSSNQNVQKHKNKKKQIIENKYYYKKRRQHSFNVPFTDQFNTNSKNSYEYKIIKKHIIKTARQDPIHSNKNQNSKIVNRNEFQQFNPSEIIENREQKINQQGSIRQEINFYMKKSKESQSIQNQEANKISKNHPKSHYSLQEKHANTAQTSVKDYIDTQQHSINDLDNKFTEDRNMRIQQQKQITKQNVSIDNHLVSQIIYLPSKPKRLEKNNYIKINTIVQNLNQKQENQKPKRKKTRLQRFQEELQMGS